MNEVKVLFSTIFCNEGIFREILKDLKENRENRPNGILIPEDLDINCGIDELYKKYIEENKEEPFKIFEFEINDNLATLGFFDVTALSKFGALLLYKINGDKTVEYVRLESTVMA